jgi:hypothetical protein
MSQPSLSRLTTDLIETYGQSAHNVVNAYRLAGERMVDFLDQRWDSAIARSAPSLHDGVRENATAAQRKVMGYYSKGIEISTAGADTVIGKFVEFADKGVQQAAANAGRFEEVTGVKALNQLAVVATPGLQAVGKLVSVLEEKTGQLAERIAAKPAARAPSSFSKARARKAA